MDSGSQPRVLAETAEWIVLDKPSGWITIPGRVSQQGEPASRPILLNWVQERYPEALTVHRLDVETTGVLLFARGPDAHRKASVWFQKRETSKNYVCLASGRPARPLMKIQEPIEGAPSTTQVEVLERFQKFQEVFHARVRPLTGRRHQIRIHLAAGGHPLLGDSRYGGPCRMQTDPSGATIEITRVALHAESLALPSGERFTAPLPQDLSGWLNFLRQSEAA